ncbi:NurA 5'-3' nuclease [Halapricum desulfuricans]|uniref:NurA 5'-3' nuclease n=1 Tax=Halapricum desulfuricans TaxID=2841257 RepID=A0A897NE84_9EURY|nr:DNA double-strand break repair nuclease NurA [Halapricum desulfuricans]QSG10848.1 NurA 5'-3' nuclease [Halapricum desulfuricans]
MTLDPVHIEGIARLAGQLGRGVGDTDHQGLAETVWAEFLDPLYADGDPVLEPLGEQRRRVIGLEDAALAESPFDTQHGLDSGTINPTTFKNGLVLDVAQAAMSAVPSDLDLHRARTVVVSAHTNDTTIDLGGEWVAYDEGYTRQRVVQVPRVDRYAQTVVHALALYLAESHHAQLQADVVEDLLILDGPIYPTGLLKWADRHPELATLLRDHERPRSVIQNYVELVETFVDRDVPLVGFVKNSASNAVTRAVRSETNAPWANDAALFAQVLARRDDDGDRRTDALTCTNWFQSRLGTDRPLSTQGGGLGLETQLDREAYEVTFFVVYDPRLDVTYRIEAPYAVTRDEETREALTRHILGEIAAERGPPLAVAKADELARIDREGKETLRQTIERQFDSERQRQYNDQRWGVDLDVGGL